MPSHNTHKYEFETGVYRPPSEGGSDSLLVRFTRNCPWNHCTFCGMYKTERFQVRGLDEIKADIDAMAAVCSGLRGISYRLGHGGAITQEAAVTLIQQVPELDYHHGFAMIYHWLLSGAATAFIQDANSLIMKTGDLVNALRYLRDAFPSISRVTSYARSKTLKQKPLEELEAIHQAVQAGFQLSEYWMPGLGGKALWREHARNTARVLNAINPHYIRSRPFHPWPGTPLTDEMDSRAFEMLSVEEQLRELKLTMEELNVTSRVCFDHAGNYWKNRKGRLLFSHSYEGYKFPEEKQTVLDLIEEGL